MHKNFLNFWKSKHYMNVFAILTAINGVGISAILLANYNYVDDMERVACGIKTWGLFSRYVDDFLSGIIHADNYLTDISPLPQLIAILVMALAGTILLYEVSDEEKISWWQIIAVVPLALSPYFLNCFSYKYDAPYMAISVLAGIFPILFHKEKPWIYVIASALGIIIVCTTYQASTGVFPMLVILLFLRKWNRKEADTFKFVLWSTIGYCIGMVIFLLFIMNPVDTYVSTSVAKPNALLGNIIEKWQTYIHYLKTDFKKEWLIYMIIIMLSFIVMSVWNSKQKKWLSLIMTGFATGGMIFFWFGLYPFLEEPQFSPRAMYGIGIFLAMVGVSATSYKKNAIIGKCVAVMLSWSFFVFSFTYGNALSVQKEYTNFRVEAAIDDIKELSAVKNGNAIVQINGSMDLSPILQNQPQDYLILNRLVPVTFCEKWYWGGTHFYYYYGLKDKVSMNMDYDWEVEDFSLYKENVYHDILVNENRIMIRLK